MCETVSRKRRQDPSEAAFFKFYLIHSNKRGRPAAKRVDDDEKPFATLANLERRAEDERWPPLQCMFVYKDLRTPLDILGDEFTGGRIGYNRVRSAKASDGGVNGGAGGTQRGTAATSAQLPAGEAPGSPPKALPPHLCRSVHGPEHPFVLREADAAAWRSGYLFKQSAKDPIVWRLQWFMVAQETLFVFNSHMDRRDGKVVELAQNAIRATRRGHGAMAHRLAHCFELHAVDRVYQLRATSLEDMMGWMQCLERAATLASEAQLMHMAEVLAADHAKSVAERRTELIRGVAHSLDTLLSHRATLIGFSRFLRGFGCDEAVYFCLDADTFARGCREARELFSTLRYDGCARATQERHTVHTSIAGVEVNSGTNEDVVIAQHRFRRLLCRNLWSVAAHITCTYLNPGLRNALVHRSRVDKLRGIVYRIMAYAAACTGQTEELSAALRAAGDAAVGGDSDNGGGDDAVDGDTFSVPSVAVDELPPPDLFSALRLDVMKFLEGEVSRFQRLEAYWPLLHSLALQPAPAAHPRTPPDAVLYKRWLPRFDVIRYRHEARLRRRRMAFLRAAGIPRETLVDKAAGERVLADWSETEHTTNRAAMADHVRLDEEARNVPAPARLDCDAIREAPVDAAFRLDFGYFQRVLPDTDRLQGAVPLPSTELRDTVASLEQRDRRSRTGSAYRVARSVPPNASPPLAPTAAPARRGSRARGRHNRAGLR